MNKPMLEDKDKVAKVYNSKGEVCETFSFRDHGNSYLSAAQNYLMQNYDKLMAEEVEQMDEGNKENKKKKNEYVSNIIKKKLSPEVLPSLKYGRRELKKEKVEQIDEISQDLALRAHAKANDVTSRRWNDKFAGADLADKGSQGMFHHSSSGEEAADRTAKRLRKHIKRKFGPEAAARAKRSEFGVVAPEHTTPKKKSFLSRLGLTKEGVEQMDEAKGEYGPDSSLHGHPLRDIDAHLKDNGYIHSKKSDTTHHYTRKDGRMVVHVDSKTKKVVKAFLEPIKKLKEEVEQMDESSGDAPIDKMSHKDLANYIGEHPEWVKKNREEAEKLAHEKTEDLQEKLTSDMSLADVIRDFVHSDNKRFKGKSKEERIDMAKGAYYGMHENKIYTNIISKLEEGRKPKPPAEGKKPSAAWLRHLERQKASGGKEPEKKKEPEHVVAQILKHQDYGYKDHEYTFHDGSKLNVTPEKRDKIIRKIQSLTGPGPGKSPEARKKLYDELNTRKGFLHHTGDEPIPVVKLHPMSAQKK